MQRQKQGFLFLVAGLVILILLLFFIYMIWYILSHLIQFSIGLIVLSMPILLAIIGAVLVKKYLLGGR